MAHTIEIPLARPLLGEAERAAVLKPLETGWLVQGPHVESFERGTAAKCGTAHGVAVSSGTTALHLALVAAGVGPGDRVALPSFTFVATANAVLQIGAHPLLCDVEPSTFNLCPADLARRVEAAGGVRAIVPVHQFGLAADMAAVREVAEGCGAVVIEDAACALGGAWRGQPLGGLGLVGCLSFHPRKVITTAEGGMLLTDDAELAARARALRSHGQVPGLPVREAYNYRLSDLHGALGCAQLERLDTIVAARRERAGHYERLLAEQRGVLRPVIPQDASPNYQSYVVRVVPEQPGRDGVDATAARRDALITELAARGIGARQGTFCVHGYPAYRELLGVEPWDLPGAWEADRTSLALPIWPGMDEAMVVRVVEALAEALRVTASGPSPA